MVKIETLERYVNEYLQIDTFQDYCPNGLQVAGKSEISSIVSGVSANLALIEAAIDEEADAIFVHHGFFWKNEPLILVGNRRNRIKALLESNTSLFAYHLPLDAHPIVGNNVCLGRLLEMDEPKVVDQSLVWVGRCDMSLENLQTKIIEKLKRHPLIFGDLNQKIEKLAWCTGAAQGEILTALKCGADAYLSGEVSEQIPAIALENNIAFIAAGHHASERYGVQALGEHLSKKFNLKHTFVEIENPV